MDYLNHDPTFIYNASSFIVGFAKDTVLSGAILLRRPYIRASTRIEVEKNAPENSDGLFLDANTGEPIQGQYDLGHKPGHEFRTELNIALSEGLTQKQFNDRMNNPNLYQIESPSSNRSHRYEAP